ncbi:MAG: tetratricopeptide repeat protein [Blastocatellia bacterium]
MTESQCLNAEQPLETDGNVIAEKSQMKISNHFFIAAVLLLTFMAYFSTLGYDFVYDDQGQIVQNGFIRSWSSAPQYFTKHVWSHVHPDQAGNYYRPVFLLWLLVNRTLFGLSPFLWHFAVIAVHLLVTLLVYLLARRLVKDELTANMAALIFGLHPVHIEGVAWISGVTEPLLALFLISAFLFYMDWRDGKEDASGDGKIAFYKKPTIRLAASLFLYTLAMLEKETALILPMAVCGYEWIKNSGSSQDQGFTSRARQSLRRAIPFIAISVVYLVVRTIVLKGLGHTLSPLPLSTVVLTCPAVLWFYTRQLIWPARLSAFQDLEYVTSPGLVNFILPAAGVIAVGFGLWMFARKSEARERYALLIASLWLVLPILPVLNISVFGEGEAVHDRYLYLPSIGFAIIVAVALRRLDFGRAKLFGRPVAHVAAAILIALAFSFITLSQHVHWATDLALFQHGLAYVPHSRIAKTGLANEYSKRDQYDDAITLYKEVIERNPTYWVAPNNLGCTYMKMGDFKNAEIYLVRGIEIRPTEPRQYLNLSVTLQAQARLDEAERAIRQAIDLQPDGYGFHYQLGDVLNAQGNLQAALEEFKTEVNNNPRLIQAQMEVASLEERLAAGNSGAKSQ